MVMVGHLLWRTERRIQLDMRYIESDGTPVVESEWHSGELSWKVEHVGLLREYGGYQWKNAKVHVCLC